MSLLLELCMEFDDSRIECRMVSSIASRASGEGLLWCKHYIIYIEYGEAQQSTYYVQLYCACLPVARWEGEGFLETRLGRSIGKECRGVGRRWTVIRLSSQLRRSLHYKYPSTIPQSIPGTRGSDVAIQRVLIRLLNYLLLMIAIQFLPYPALWKAYRRGKAMNTPTMYYEFLNQMSDYHFLKDSYPCRNYLFQISVITQRFSAFENGVFFVRIIINFEFLYQICDHQFLKRNYSLRILSFFRIPWSAERSLAS